MMNGTHQCFADNSSVVVMQDGADVDRCVRTPDELMKVAAQGLIPKSVLANLLELRHRHAYLDACAAIEKKYTENCTATNDPCLESGCALEGEICLEPLMRAGVEYHQACAAEWIKVFTDPRNRIDAWKH